jgi:hypothetical protein
LKKLLLASILASSSLWAVNINSIGASVGSLGTGVSLTSRLTHNFTLRVTKNNYTYSSSKEVSDINYDFDAKLDNTAVMFDYFPSPNSGFKLSIGYIYNNNAVNFRNKDDISASINIGGFVYEKKLIDSIVGSTSSNDSPYIGIGYANRNVRSGLSFFSDFGIMKNETTLSLVTTCSDNVNPLVCKDIQYRTNEERKSIQSDLDDIDYYPVINFGVRYNF